MSIISNLYAEKVFSEHPISLWALDDKADYISLISENQRDISAWSISGGTAELFTDISDEPFINSHVTKLIATVPSDSTGQITAVGPDIVNLSELNKDLGTFAVGTYVYSYSPYITGFEIGYEYNDTTTGENVQNVKTYNTSVYDSWIFASETFHIPSDNTTIRPVLKINFLHGTENQNDYSFLVNGLTVGQWSEEFNSTSLGVEGQLIPSSINLPTLRGVEAKAYGLQENSGYYILDEKSLTAKNSGVPMVYGSSNTTILVPNDNDHPALIIPGVGFLNESGKFKEYTLEMWLRVSSDSNSLKRIFGPIGSQDGLYVNGPFITLKIDNNIGSYCVGEWDRPMLIHIRVTKDSANLLINGEQVITLSFITNNLTLASKSLNGKDQDWLAFYAYEDVSPIEIDCVGLYPYQVPSVVAKKRFIYGQAVQIPENINTAYSGNSVFIDYPFANYANNYIYPDLGRWSQGIVDNLTIDNNVLSIPDYKIPSLISNSETLSSFYTRNQTNSPSAEFFSLSNNSCLFFDSFNPINDQIISYYGVFEFNENVATKQTLIRIEDKLTNNYFSIDLHNTDIEYNLSISGEEITIYKSLNIYQDQKFSAGINVQDFSDNFGGEVASFFGNRSGLSVYVGGTKELTQTFEGKIYSVTFSNARNHSLIADLFSTRGMPVEYEDVFSLYSQQIAYDGGTPSNPDEQLDGGFYYEYSQDRLLNHTGSYTVAPTILFDKFILDVGVNSYWEDHVPLTYFAKYVKDVKGNDVYDLDFIQFNINYPSPSRFVESSSVSGWTYDELQAQYQNPIQRTYESLDNHLFTGYNNYVDLSAKSIKSYNYDTQDSLVKTYISFQYVVDGANKHSSAFKYLVSADASGVVKPGTYVVDYAKDSSGNPDMTKPIYDNLLTTKYEVVNNTVIYPPSGLDINSLALVIHIEVNVPNILNKPLKIKTLQLSSRATSSTSASEIGTMLGTPIYPYTKSGVYYNYKNENPFTIYKGSSPYLYLTRYSGIQVRGRFDPSINRGVAVPINKNLSGNYKVMAMQVATRYDQDFFPYAPTQIFEIEHRNGLLKFYMVADSPSGKRAKIYAINSNTGQTEDGITFYLNGNLVNDPVITVKEWAFIGISFSSLLVFDNFIGSFKINGPLLTNLISDYKSTNLQEVQTVTKRPWFKVKYSGPIELQWDYWDVAFKWKGILVLSSKSYYGANPSDIYKSYAGTNKIIVDDYSTLDENPKILSFNNYEYNLYTDIRWQSSIQDAV
jgi:hypothetical protein